MKARRSPTCSRHGSAEYREDHAARCSLPLRLRLAPIGNDHRPADHGADAGRGPIGCGSEGNRLGAGIDELLANSPQVRAADIRVEFARREFARERRSRFPTSRCRPWPNGTALGATTVSTLFALPVPVYNRNQGNISIHGQAFARPRPRPSACGSYYGTCWPRRSAVIRWPAIRSSLRHDILPDAKENLDIVIRGSNRANSHFRKCCSAQFLLANPVELHRRTRRAAKGQRRNDRHVIDRRPESRLAWRGATNAAGHCPPTRPDQSASGEHVQAAAATGAPKSAPVASSER